MRGLVGCGVIGFVPTLVILAMADTRWEYLPRDFVGGASVCGLGMIPCGSPLAPIPC